MPKFINSRELARQYAASPAQCVAHLTESLEQRHLRPDHFSVQDLFVSLIENGSELLRAISNKKSGGMPLLEAAAAVDTSAFSNITGQIIFTKIKEAFELPTFLWPELCDSMDTVFLESERIPGVGGPGDSAEEVEEGQPYPTVGLNEEYIDLPRTVRKGFIIPVTRDIIIADRTGLLLKRCGDNGTWLGVAKEKVVLDTSLGVVNSYKRNGTASNTYLTSGAYINRQINPLVDYTDVENAWLLLQAITDPNTGEPILNTPDTMIVPQSLVMTTMRILKSTGVSHVDNTASADTIRYTADNPIPGVVGKIKVLSSQYVKLRANSSTSWWFGQPKKAFLWRQVWDIETVQAASNSELEFTSDIFQRFKVSYRGAPGVQEPRVMCQNTGS